MNIFWEERHYSAYHRGKEKIARKKGRKERRERGRREEGNERERENELMF